MFSVEENLRLMKMLHDAWNAQDWDQFMKLHAEKVAVYWPGQAEPTRGRTAHRLKGEEFFKTFPDNRVENNPYLVLFGQGDWTCSIGIMSGTRRGPVPGPGGSEIPATNRTFRMEFCTVARWKNGEIIEERLFYDPTAMMRQLGPRPEPEGGAGCDPELSSMGRRR